MPVKCSVSDQETPVSEDVCMEMSYHINEDGLIQITPLPDISLLYETFHNDSLGSTWAKHHTAFSELISKYNPKNILEIGGGSGILSNIYHNKYSGTPWTIFDINTTPCPADLTGDDQVNIDDIFAVLGLWGECPDPCPPYCEGDITEDCTVSIDDIFAILGLWGLCE